MNAVISLGGSIIVPKEIDSSFLEKFRKLILDFVKKGNKVAIVAGGGYTCRWYNKTAEKINRNVSHEDLDWLGIKATKLNAELVRVMFGDLAYEEVIDNPTAKINTNKQIIVGSGWKPGCSSDKDAVLLAINLKMDTVINLSNISYVYDKDPNKYSDAKKLEKISWEEMQKIVGTKWVPGANVPFDPEATKLAKNKKLKVIIAKGTDLENLKNILEGKKYKGTTICS
ncbi:UMP kinase [Candidatus Woesearchaeota archaeon]|nr:UMP kinase [Candidatus Woesearchaeota archaeon]